MQSIFKSLHPHNMLLVGKRCVMLRSAKALD